MKNNNMEELGQQLSKKIKRVLGQSLHIRHIDSGSSNACESEMTALTNPIYDVQRFGIDFVASPRHADMLMVTGGVTRNLERALRMAFEAAAAPKMVVAIGTCASGGGIIGETYANYGGVDKIVPVYVYVPGCPPRPHAILEGVLIALDKLEAYKKARL